MKFNRRLIQKTSRSIGSACLTMGVSLTSFAIDYGVYDARSLAMGGASVASGTGQHAQFSNPALLSTYAGKEEDTRNGRVYFPTVTVQASTSIEDTLDIIDLELDDQISTAVDNFNASPNAANADAVAAATQTLQTELLNLGSQSLDGDVFAGFSVSEPGDREGGSFYFGFRAIGDGRSNITQADINLLQSYIDSMRFVSSGGAEGALDPSLFDADNNTLISPADTVTSSASISSMAMAEWGVAFSKEFQILGQYLAFGATPKLMRIEVFSENLTYTNADLDYNESKRQHFTYNADLGMLWMVGDYVRLGIAAKDVLPKSFEAANGLTVETKARSRFGAAFVQRYITVGLDVDLQKNESLGGVLSTQDVSFGLELNPIPWLQLRGGYRHDLEGARADIVSAGAGFRVGRFVADVGYSSGDDSEGGAVQLGWTF